jgi:flagellar biosynthetic protein FliR
MFGTGVAQEPEPTIATLLTLGGIVLAMKAGLHIALVAALARLYDVLPFGQFPIGDEMGAWSVGRISAAFAIGMSLAFPFIVISFIYNVALGAMSRAMPQLLVSLVGAPLLVGLGMLTLYLVLPELYASWRPVMQAVLAFPLVDLR